MNTKELDNRFVAPTYARYPVEIISGKGALLRGADGKDYIDLGSGIAVNIFGMCDDEWKNAVQEQLDNFQHVSNLYYSSPCANLAKLLCEKTGMKKVFFANSGAEANECAIKAARRVSFLKHGDESHSTIITLKNSFHGRTIATLTATGQDSFHKEFGPFLDGFVYAEANNLDDIKTLAENNNAAAVMVEVIQGEGGVKALDRDFVIGIEKLCREKDMLFIVDEVQSGNGRSGMLYAYMNYGVKPDIVTTAKGLGGGLPIGATLLGERAENAFGYGSHGSTFGGNPISCAGGLNILSRIDDKLLDAVKSKSAYIFNTLNGAKGVKSVSGMGLMIGLEIEKDAKEVVAECINRGVLMLTAKDRIRLLPPLNIPDDLLKSAINILKEVLAQ
ncbi:MAG: acetylornithine/succinylornithine family transaminase [Firmicutes bacterium]|nr:acetylornithine/succinylornithine family transaminase [Bacillota bacterium]